MKILYSRLDVILAVYGDKAFVEICRLHPSVHGYEVKQTTSMHNKRIQNILTTYSHFIEVKQISGGSSVSQNKLPQLILGYIYILKYLQSNFIG